MKIKPSVGKTAQQILGYCQSMGVLNKHQTTSLVLARHEDLAWLNWLLLISSCQQQSVCHSTQCYKMFDYQNCIYIIKFQCQVHIYDIFLLI